MEAVGGGVLFMLSCLALFVLGGWMLSKDMKGRRYFVLGYVGAGIVLICLLYKVWDVSHIDGVEAFIIALGCLVFFPLGGWMLSKDMKRRWQTVSIKTRICFVLGYVGAGIVLICLLYYLCYEGIVDDEVEAFIIALGCLVFIPLGGWMLSEDKKGRRQAVSIKTRICFALCFVGAGIVGTRRFEGSISIGIWLGIVVAILCLALLPLKLQYPQGEEAVSSIQNPNLDSVPNRVSDVPDSTPVENKQQSVSKVCKFCGREAGNGEIFCVGCGHRF